MVTLVNPHHLKLAWTSQYFWFNFVFALLLDLEDFAMLMFMVPVVSLIYWIRPLVGSYRRELDTQVSLTVTIYHVWVCCAEISDTQVRSLYLTLTFIFCALYVAAKKSKDYYFSCVCHMNLHLIAVCGNMILYHFLAIERPKLVNK